MFNLVLLIPTVQRYRQLSRIPNYRAWRGLFLWFHNTSKAKVLQIRAKRNSANLTTYTVQRHVVGRFSVSFPTDESSNSSLNGMVSTLHQKLICIIVSIIYVCWQLFVGTKIDIYSEKCNLLSRFPSFPLVVSLSFATFAVNMEVNKAIIRDLYKEYNKLYFGGVLSLCDCHYIKLDAFGRYTNQNGKGKIWITNDVDWTEETLREILVHEMIHHYVKNILGKNEYLFFRHGFRFRHMMRKLNKEFGLGITVRARNLHKRS